MADKNTLIIWDWDGTLINSEPSVRRALNDLAQHYQLPAITDKDVSNVMNQHVGTFWHQFNENVMDAFKYFLNRFEYYNSLKTLEVFDGILPAMKWLKAHHIDQMVISNKPQYLLDEEFKGTPFDGFFIRLIGTDLKNNEKKPDVLFGQKALKGLHYSNLIMIGDGRQDMDFARAIGAKAWYVCRQVLPGVPFDLHLKKQQDILPALKKYFGYEHETIGYMGLE